MKFLFAFLLLLITPAALAQDDLVGDYVLADFKAMAELPWKFKVHDMNDDDVLDTFAMIAQCDMYRRYYADDFKWQTIRVGMRRELKYFIDDIPSKYYIDAFVPLGRYDFDKAAFEIDEDYTIDNAGAIKIPFYDPVLNLCGTDRIDADYFPLNIKFLADNKFSLTHVPVPPDEANDLLQRIAEYRYGESKSRSYANRIIPLRFKISILGINKYESDAIPPQILYEGSLDEIQFFEDPYMQTLLWRRRFKEID